MNIESQLFKFSPPLRKRLTFSSERLLLYCNNVQQKQARNILEQQLSEGLKNAGQKDIKSGKVLDYAYAETADKLNKSAGKYSKAASILQVAADTFSTGVKTLVSLFKSGIDNQYRAYENTFSNLATRICMIMYVYQKYKICGDL